MNGRRERGAALLIAMIIVALVATLASAMVWQQWRAVQVETVERARTQSAWILTGAGDFARLFLREDDATIDYLGEPWSVPLQEARLSTFLSADKDNTDDGPEAFLSGLIIDAQSRYNLRNITTITDPEKLAIETKRMERLLDSVGTNGSDLAPRIAVAMRAAFTPPQPASAAASGATTTTATVVTFLQPQTIDQLAWFGIDDDSIARMKPFFTILPAATRVNINTASKEVLAAVAGIEIGTAQQWIQRRRFTELVSSIDKISPGLTTEQKAGIAETLDTKSSYFEVHSRLRLEDRVLEETSLVQRNSGTREVTTILRRRESSRETAG